MTDIPPSTALINGTVRPSANGPVCSAILLSGERVAALGSDGEIRRRAPSGTKVVDLGGQSVLPAITDSHTHYHRAAQLEAHFLDFTQLAPKSVDDVLRLVRERAFQNADPWMQGDNLSAHALREQRLPTRQELDSVCPSRPVILRTVGKHGISANTMALRAAGITAATPDPVGGRIERDDDGEPTGVLHETAKLRLDATRADTVVPALDESRRLDALEAGITRLNQYGIAEIHEIVQSPDEMADYFRLREQGRLRARVVFYIRVVEGQATLDDLKRLGLRSGIGDDWLRVGGVKVSIDGSCTLHNAAIYGGYADQPHNDGLVRIPETELDELVADAAAHGLQVAVHAIGQRAVDMALAALEAATAIPGSVGLRHRVEHAYLAPRAGQLERLRDVGAVVSTQPAFLVVNGDSWPAMFGDETDRMMPMASLLALGIPTQINTDYPNAPLNPLINLQAAVDRRTRSGVVVGPNEAVTAAQAWSVATEGSAYGAFEERRRGRLTAGFLADLVVLSDDPVARGDLRTTRVAATYVGGRCTWSDGAFDAAPVLEPVEVSD